MYSKKPRTENEAEQPSSMNNNNSPHIFLCQLCSEKVVPKKSRSEYLEFEYQCDKCLFPGEKLVELYDFSKECSICFEEFEDYVVLECKHHLCIRCAGSIHKDMCTECPFCRKKSKRERICSTENLKFESPSSEILGSVKKLARRWNDKEGIILLGHKSTLSLISEYLRWLSIVSENPSGSEDISPPICIDELWRFHMIDSKDYFNVCMDVFGKFIHYTIENTFFGSNNEEKLERTKNIMKSKMNETSVTALVKIWKFDKPYVEMMKRGLCRNYICILVRGNVINLTMIKLESLDVTISDLKLKIEEKTGHKSQDFVLHFMSELLPDDKSLKECGIGDFTMISFTKLD